MISLRKSRFTIAVVLGAAVILTAGGAAIASNTGFKLNRSVLAQTVGTGVNGNYWIALPYFHPYANGLDFCQKAGLTTAGISQHSLTRITTAGTPTTLACGAAAAFPMNKGEAIMVKPANNSPVQSIIIVGSHDPAARFSIPASQGQLISFGNLWFSVPYHTTAVTIRDLCVQVGMTLTGLNQGAVEFVNPEQNAAQTVTVACGAPAATSTNLILGKGYRLRNPTAVNNFLPAHF